jgi:iron complex outermembrane receptor protein
MTGKRKILTSCCVASLVGLAGLASAPAAWAQSRTDDAEDANAVEEVVVTGLRRRDVTAAESPLPIDIITGESLVNQGTSDINDVLREQVPSLNVQRFVTNDGAAFTRPFSLRGLPPDQTLVLVNGKRRHRGATVQFTNIPYIRGSQGPDLSAIPSIAVGQLEVLRDGASAVYGSDAIAGVLNFRLRDDRDGATLIARYGKFYAGDGQDVLLQGNIGLPLTAEGFLNVSAELSDSEPTSRGVQRPDAQALINAGVAGVPNPAQRWGNPDAQAARIFLNAGIDLSSGAELYAFGNFSRSEGTTAFFYRNPNTSFIATSIPLTTAPGGARFSFRQLFPGGFAPEFGATIEDSSLVGGVRGELASKLTYDLSAGFGRNKAEYVITNTVNPSLGLASPTSFRPGELEQREFVANLDLTYPLEVGLASPLSLAGGLEYRKETYEVTAGELASYQVGPFASVVDPDTGTRTGLPVGSNGFPGFSPVQAGTFERDDWAGYAALEGDLTEALSFGLAARYEDFSDVGENFSWKVSARYEINDAIAVRGSVNTGFRAPTPGQANASLVQTNINSVTGDPLTTGIVSPQNPVARFFGATSLRPEESFNVAAGIALRPTSRLTVTLDYFEIEVDDRIALSGNFRLTQAQRDQLAALGVPGGGSFEEVSFFTNSFDSRTRGLDLVLSYGGMEILGGTLGLNANLNYTKTEVMRATPVISADRERLLELEDFVPETKGSLSLNYRRGRLTASTQAAYYGEWTDFGGTPSADQTGGSEVLIDAEIGLQLTDRLQLTVGAENLLDAYPDREARPSQINNGIRYLRFAPTGFNGGFWYVRAKAEF